MVSAESRREVLGLRLAKSCKMHPGTGPCCLPFGIKPAGEQQWRKEGTLLSSRGSHPQILMNFRWGFMLWVWAWGQYCCAVKIILSVL